MPDPIATLDAIALAVLVCLVAWTAHRQHLAAREEASARAARREYDRARRDYERLLRHRIGNPLAVVQGVALTLDAHPDLPEPTRAELVSSMLVAVESLTQVSVDPHPRSIEERSLRPIPLQPSRATLTA